MYLIDTSVWIDYLREKNTKAVDILEKILDSKQFFGITSVIYQEILQGASSKHDFDKLVKYFSTQNFYHPKNPLASYQEAAHIYFTCRKQGITIRSTIDCLIAQISIEQDLIILHNDEDYIRLAKILPKLQLLD